MPRTRDFELPLLGQAQGPRLRLTEYQRINKSLMLPLASIFARAYKQSFMRQNIVGDFIIICFMYFRKIYRSFDIAWCLEIMMLHSLKLRYTFWPLLQQGYTYCFYSFDKYYLRCYFITHCQRCTFSLIYLLFWGRRRCDARGFRQQLYFASLSESDIGCASRKPPPPNARNFLSLILIFSKKILLSFWDAFLWWRLEMASQDRVAHKNEAFWYRPWRSFCAYDFWGRFHYAWDDGPHDKHLLIFRHFRFIVFYTSAQSRRPSFSAAMIWFLLASPMAIRQRAALLKFHGSVAYDAAAANVRRLWAFCCRDDLF